jgi:eukaryotic-like serine/threonine-protein kinase
MLRREIESLLNSDNETTDFVEAMAQVTAKVLAAEPATPLVGHRLAQYLILEKIGAGGMGEVYRAHDERLGRDVAIKVLLALSDHPEARKRLWREARAAASINHPNVCQL